MFMTDHWQILTRVRDLRAKLAFNEASQKLQIQSRALAAFEQSRRRQAQFSEQAARAHILSSSLYEKDEGDLTFTAGQAQDYLSCALGARLKAQEAAIATLRAQLVYQRARDAAADVREKYRRALARRETVASHHRRSSRIALRRQVEQEDETLAEERLNSLRVVTGECE
jgi:hypothetical protein